MICVICHGDEIEVREVEEEIRIDSDIVHVPIQVPVCQTCGERYYDRQTMRYLEEVEQKLEEGGTELSQVGRVLRYS